LSNFIQPVIQLLGQHVTSSVKFRLVIKTKENSTSDVATDGKIFFNNNSNLTLLAHIFV